MAECEGWLTKEGGAIKNWKKRWCIFADGQITYYTAQPSKNGKQKGSIPLSIMEKVQKLDYKKKKNCFEIQTPDRNYHLFAATPEETEKWVEVLNKALNDAKPAGEAPRASESSASSSTSDSSPSSEAPAASPAGEGVVDRPKVNDFQSLKVIGKGSFGKVLQVRYKKTGQIYAMKVLNKKTILDRNELDHTKAEKNILMKLTCPFLVRLYYSFQTPDKLYFVMDYVNGGELFYHLQKEKTFSPKRVQFYGAEIVIGLEYLHNQGVIYRDLKPENILLTAEGHICMTDFGISKEGLVAKDDRTATFCGTPEYLAPEVLEGKGYGKEVDWWSFGTLMYEMFTGLPPFYSEDVQLMYSKIMNAKLKFPSNIPSEAANLIEGLLTRDPAKRLADPVAIKAHPYFANIDWDKLVNKELKPPYIPPVKSDLSTDMIDPSFTGEDATLSVNEKSELSRAEQENFGGFTYVAPSNLK
jgi:RAC serine/threonine-protein kinase